MIWNDTTKRRIELLRWDRFLRMWGQIAQCESFKIMLGALSSQDAEDRAIAVDTLAMALSALYVGTAGDQ